jgi:hypothetical protein
VLSVWKHKRVTNRYKSAPGPRDTHYVVVQLQDDPIMANSSSAQKQQDDNCRLCKGQAGLIHRLCNPKQLFLHQDDSDY